MLDRAKAANARMRASFAQGFELDEHHQPHVTILQRYVRTAELDAVFDAVGKVLGAADVGKISLTAVKFSHMYVAAYPGVGLAGILVIPSSEVLDFQARLIEAVKPFTESGGSAEAYVRTEAEPEINDTTVRYIDAYVPEHSGSNYLAHVTVGLAKLDDLATIEAQPFDTFTFSPAGISVYQLGNNRTAARHLRSWSV
jgi:hypothetical protein